MATERRIVGNNLVEQTETTGFGQRIFNVPEYRTTVTNLDTGRVGTARTASVSGSHEDAKESGVVSALKDQLGKL